MYNIIFLLFSNPLMVDLYQLRYPRAAVCYLEGTCTKPQPLDIVLGTKPQPLDIQVGFIYTFAKLRITN